jgi:hypothetical protein
VSARSRDGLCDGGTLRCAIIEGPILPGRDPNYRRALVAGDRRTPNQASAFSTRLLNYQSRCSASKALHLQTTGLDLPWHTSRYETKRLDEPTYAQESERDKRELVMKWKYYIPHVWNSPEDRTVWEDVWLLPEDGSNDGKSYWFTLNALCFGAAGIDAEYPHDPDDPFGGFGGSEAVRAMNLQLLGDRDYFITPVLDMVARVEDFNLRELLAWTTVFIKDHFGDPDPELVPGDYEEFGGTNAQVLEIGRITEALESGVPEDQVINYRRPEREDRPC